LISRPRGPIDCVKHRETEKTVKVEEGRAIAQAVSRWLPITAAWVQTRVYSCEICGGHIGTGAGFSQSTSVFPANLHSTNFSTITITYHPGLVQ
jgi:hypothetical protein